MTDTTATERAISDLRAECAMNGQGHFATIKKSNGRLILEALAAQPSAGAQGEAVAWLETNKLTGEVRVSLIRRADTPTMQRRWDTQPLGLISRSAPVPELLAQARTVIEELMYARTDKAEAMATEWLATPAQPDTGCYTEADGSCTATGPCMHTPAKLETGDVAALREARFEAFFAGFKAGNDPEGYVHVNDAWDAYILAALSKPNAPGREG